LFVPSAVQFVKAPLVGVPRIGVTKVGLVDRTAEPEPVEVATPVPPEATGRGFVRETTCDPLTVIAVVSPVWMSSEFELSPVEISPPGDVVVLLIIDGI
jgi:hypothetical protein